MSNSRRSPSWTLEKRRFGSTDIHMSLGESMNVGSHRSLPGHARTYSEPARELTPPSFISKLPSAVASVPPDDVRGYVHSKRVTHYMIGNTLGEGSFAKVKEGFHVQVGEKVAVKVIDKKKALKDAYVAKNFRREAKLLQMVHHPNILQLLEVVETDNSYYLITELCSGGDLMKHIYKMGKLDETEARKYMRQIVSAVDHLHRAGIIHRDLKVENLLLDATGNIKIIDFGLSNEEYVQEDAGMVHCSTQCGSPAYAAPELLGHKEYGPEVDVWSIGVNMYAMLTGCLPYTVEPFNITALHAKMLENKMNPIPSNLSQDCTDLLEKLLTSSPSERIKMEAVMEHPWLNKGCRPLQPSPFPNKLSINDVDEDIVEHMTYVLKVKPTEDEVREELLANRASSTTAIYYLLTARLDRYNRQKPVRVKRRLKPLSDRSQTSTEDIDDTQSIVSCPTRPRKDHTPQHRGILRPITREHKTRPFPDEVSAEAPGNPAPQSRLRQRRNTLPSELMEREVAKLHNQRNPKSMQQPFAQKRKTNTLPRGGYRPDTTYHSDRGHDHDPFRPTTQLNPVRPPPNARLRNSTSQPHGLSQLTHDLTRHMAWHSQPSSRAGSLANSRNSSRQPSATSRHTSQSSITHHHSPTDLDSDVCFHEVESSSTSPFTSPMKHSYTHPLQRESPNTSGIHFPSIAHGNARERSRSIPSKYPVRKNGHMVPSDIIKLHTELSVPVLISKLQRIADKLNISSQEEKGSTLHFKCKNTQFQVSVERESSDTCQFCFTWLSGDSATYVDLRTKMVKKCSV